MGALCVSSVCDWRVLSFVKVTASQLSQFSIACFNVESFLSFVTFFLWCYNKVCFCHISTTFHPTFVIYDILCWRIITIALLLERQRATINDIQW